MKFFTSFLIFGLFVCSNIEANAQTRPAYCDQLPTSFEKGAQPTRPSLPKFDTKPITQYKVQVAVLRNTDPTKYPFHSKLVARYRPCEEVWVIESRETFATRTDANRMKNEMRTVGYPGTYVTEIVGYE